jgi:hypothetical protein
LAFQRQTLDVGKRAQRFDRLFDKRPQIDNPVAAD